MMKTEEFYHTFIIGKTIVPDGVLMDIYIYRRDKKQVLISLWKYTWENGKYYYFGNTDNNYTLTPMINGN